jgi:hypothetical protein
MKKFVTTLVSLCFLASNSTFAQTTNATLGGTISDASAALIPGVSVTATNLGTGIVTTVISNEAGAYQFASLQTGTYRVSAELPGFQTQTYQNVVLGVSQQVRLNFALQVGSVAQAIEVTVAADTLLATSSSSVGAVLPDSKLRELPLRLGNVLDLLATTPGASSAGGFQGSFAGGRISAANVTRDGISVTDSRFEFGAYSAVYQSPDMVEEVRVIVAPVDAETSRGSGQVQMVTRSGTNQYRGSVFWYNQNSALSANSWFNNFNRNEKDYYNRNEYGARFGGPIIRNKTFFFALFEGQRIQLREYFTGIVLTEPAKQGIFRYFPGVDSGNAISIQPNVDRNGNPVRPAAATGDLRSFSVFGRDAMRAGFDTSSFGREQLALMPAPNDFTVGDGLNTAGIRFVRRIPGREISSGGGYEINRDQYNVRLDHNFNANHKVNLVATKETNTGPGGNTPVRQWPTGYDGNAEKRRDLYTINLVSTLSPTLLNQVNLGRLIATNNAHTAANRTDAYGQEAFKHIPQSNGIPFLPRPVLTQPFVSIGGVASNRDSVNPLYVIGDTLSWTQGTHAFKWGGEWRRSGTDNLGLDPDITPRALYGAGGVPVTGIDATAFPGLTGANQTAARNLLIDLSGSIAQVVQNFHVTDPSNPTWAYYPSRVRTYGLQTEFSGFFKDIWKLRPELTLNLGLRYDWFGVPYDGKSDRTSPPYSGGIVGAPVGRMAGMCGISCGGLTTIELVGKNSINPDKKIKPDDFNNFAPSIGFSWSVPWWGKDKTVLRGGYGISYTNPTRNWILFENGPASLPGLVAGANGMGLFYSTSNYLSMANLRLPIPIPYQPLASAPLTDRTGSIAMFDQVTPYIQNWNLEVQREVAANTTVEVGYIATKGTKLINGLALNRVKIAENGILDAFNVTRAGGNAPLFDNMLRGLNLGLGPVNGTTVTGSASLRNSTLTRAFLANGSAGLLANFLNFSTTVTNQGGGLLRNSGLFPENFIVLNPQFTNVTVLGNPDSSTYHSLRLQMTKRLSSGFTNTTTYVWSRTLGAEDREPQQPNGIAYRDVNNRALDKTLLGYHRTHAIKSNGTWNLPFGPNRALLSTAPGWVSRIVEGWQFGGIFSWESGAPLTITSGLGTISASTNATPDIVGNLPKSTGQVTTVANGVTYFTDLRQIVDPSLAGVTSQNGLSGNFSNKAITDEQGNVLLVNPRPGAIGNLGLGWLQGPPTFGLDINLIKRVRITETKEFQLRVDGINMLNHPNFGVPDTNLNSNTFGRITTATGNRQFVTSLRLNF